MNNKSKQTGRRPEPRGSEVQRFNRSGRLPVLTLTSRGKPLASKNLMSAADPFTRHGNSLRVRSDLIDLLEIPLIQFPGTNGIGIFIFLQGAKALHLA